MDIMATFSSLAVAIFSILVDGNLDKILLWILFKLRQVR